MKKLLTTILCLSLLLPFTADAAITMVQQKSATSASITTNQVTFTMTSTPTNGNVILGAFGNGGTGTIVTAVTQTGVTWLQVSGNGSAAAGGAVPATVWRGNVGSGAGTSVVVTYSSSSGSAQSCISEWSGVNTDTATSTQFDMATSSPDGTLKTILADQMVTTNANDVFVGIGRESTGSATTSNPTNGFSFLLPTGNNAAQCFYQIVSSTGTYSTSYGLTSNAVLSSVSAVALKASSASAPTGRMILMSPMILWAPMIIQ